MKNLKLILILYTSITIGQIKSAEITYKVKLDRKKVNVITEDSKKKAKLYNLIDQEMRLIEMRLKFDGKKSSFVSEFAMETDDNKSKFFRKRAISSADLNSNFYYNLENKKILRQREFDGKNYNIMSNTNDLKWNITKETRKIGRYSCTKATTVKTFEARGKIINLDVVAWFSTEIPIPLGPKNYVSLPGLILELKEGRRTYFVSKINLSPKNKSKIGLYKKGVIVSELEYSKIISGSLDKWVNSVKN